MTKKYDGSTDQTRFVLTENMISIHYIINLTEDCGFDDYVKSYWRQWDNYIKSSLSELLTLMSKFITNLLLILLWDFILF